MFRAAWIRRTLWRTLSPSGSGWVNRKVAEAPGLVERPPRTRVWPGRGPPRRQVAEGVLLLAVLQGEFLLGERAGVLDRGDGPPGLAVVDLGDDPDGHGLRSRWLGVTIRAAPGVEIVPAVDPAFAVDQEGDGLGLVAEDDRGRLALGEGDVDPLGLLLGRARPERLDQRPGGSPVITPARRPFASRARRASIGIACSSAASQAEASTTACAQRPGDDRRSSWQNFGSITRPGRSLLAL